MSIPHTLSKAQLDKTIGAHFQDVFDEFNVEVKDFEAFISIFKEYYFEYISLSTLYPNVEETIRALHSREIKVALLTTKAQDQADRIIDYFNFRKYFSFVMGRRPNIKMKPDAEPLLLIADALKVPKDKIIMVGDTEFDIRCARNAGILSCAVEYGYRTVEQIAAEKPDFTVQDISKLLDLV